MPECTTGTIKLSYEANAEHPKEGICELAVLVLREDSAWCAIALDMGIRSYGNTVAESFDNLKDAVATQVTFTIEHGDWTQLFATKAEQRYLDTYWQAKSAQAQDIVSRGYKQREVNGEAVVSSAEDENSRYELAT